MGWEVLDNNDTSVLEGADAFDSRKVLKFDYDYEPNYNLSIMHGLKLCKRQMASMKYFLNIYNGFYGFIYNITLFTTYILL